MAYYVFRINYSDYFSLIRKELIVQKKLRQGWGTYDMRVDQGYEVYKAGWQAHWEKVDNFSVCLPSAFGLWITDI